MKCKPTKRYIRPYRRRTLHTAKHIASMARIAFKPVLPAEDVAWIKAVYRYDQKLRRAKGKKLSTFGIKARLAAKFGITERCVRSYTGGERRCKIEPKRL
jgi:hypothetical protein